MFRRPIPSLLVAASLGTDDTTEAPEIYDIDQDVSLRRAARPAP